MNNSSSSKNIEKSVTEINNRNAIKQNEIFKSFSDEVLIFFLYCDLLLLGLLLHYNNNNNNNNYY